MPTLTEKARGPAAGAAVAASLVLAAGCLGDRSTAERRAERASSEDATIHVAAAFPWEARDEILFGKGLDLAVDEVNAAGGVGGRPLELVIRDDGGSVREGKLIAQELVDDPRIMAVIGHLQSYVSIPAAAVYDLAGLPMIAPTSTSPDLTRRGYDRVFRLLFTDRDTGREMAEFAARKGYDRVAVVYERTVYGRGAANAFGERASEVGVEIVGRASYDPGGARRNLGQRRLLERLERERFDALFVAGQVPQAGHVLEEARSLGIDQPVLGTDAMASTTLIEEGGEAAAGTVLPVPFHPADPRPQVQEFVEAFRTRFGVEPDAGAALAYDAVKLLARAMRTAGTPAPAEVSRVLRTTDGWSGVTGRMAFDEAGDLAGRPRIVKVVVRDGRLAFLESSPSATGRPGASPPAVPLSADPEPTSASRRETGN